MILTTNPEKKYELLDSGEGEKLERYGNFILSRPDPQALWPKKLLPEKWKNANANFSRESQNTGWKFKKDLPKKWEINFAGLKFLIKPTAFKHTGLFPEQSQNWKWLEEKISKAGRPVSVLNLFGYTGGATLAAAKAGAEVCHVDGSKAAITWAKENAKISGLESKPIRWILDDALAFVGREIKRGKFYDGIIMDPPAFGRGPEGEMWKIEENFLDLVSKCKQILSKEPLFFLVNGYSSGYSALAYENNLSDLVEKFGGVVESGELVIKESGAGRLLPCGIFGRWSRG